MGCVISLIAMFSENKAKSNDDKEVQCRNQNKTSNENYTILNSNEIPIVLIGY